LNNNNDNKGTVGKASRQNKQDTSHIKLTTRDPVAG